MSAQLSSTASINFDPDKKTVASSLQSQDPEINFKDGRFTNPSNSESEVLSVRDSSKVFTANTTPQFQPLRLLVVDESSHVRQMCCEVAEGFGFVGVEAETITAAREILERKNTDVLILDLTWPESGSKSFLVEMKALSPNTFVIGMSSSATIASAVETMQIGACDYLSKPFPLHILTQAFERANRRLCFETERRKLQKAVNRWSGMGDALGQSEEMAKLYRVLSSAADSRHPVMIVGESGTGTELVARSIHSNSPDSSKPFVFVDCRSMSSDLLESTLFGGSRSASGKEGLLSRGLLTALDGGTVFLDGIEALTLGHQGRLAKTLQEKRIWHSNGIQGHNLSVRILAATSHDLTHVVNQGRFRMDLFRLLSVVNLKIPPLRGRSDDIAFLAERFLEKIGSTTGIPRTLSQETLRMLATYDWPENTLELEAAITHAYSVSAGSSLEIDHLPQRIQTYFRKKDEGRKHNLTPVRKPNDDQSQERVVPIATMEQYAILKALRRTSGDKILAAELLGIGKTTLYRKLKEYQALVKP
jgi:DNA-binding NtrC family response regulator